MRHQGLIAANAAQTDVVEVGRERIAYRAFGREGDTPLLLCHRFRGTIDHWDPALLDTIAARRTVVVFDSVGVGRSTGSVPTSMIDMADIAAGVVRALGVDEVDVLGWSMGGGVTQHLALRQPGLVRRLVLAGTGPGGVADSPAPPPEVGQVAGKPENDDADFLYLFFHDTATSRSLGKQHLARLGHRGEPFGPQVRIESFQAQLHALITFSAGEEGTLDQLDDIGQPALVANGHHDRMVHAYNSYVMAQRLPDAELILYPDAGHGFLFQQPERFGNTVAEFLS